MVGGSPACRARTGDLHHAKGRIKPMTTPTKWVGRVLRPHSGRCAGAGEVQGTSSCGCSPPLSLGVGNPRWRDGQDDHPQHHPESPQEHRRPTPRLVDGHDQWGDVTVLQGEAVRLASDKLRVSGHPYPASDGIPRLPPGVPQDPEGTFDIRRQRHPQRHAKGPRAAARSRASPINPAASPSRRERGDAQMVKDAEAHCQRHKEEARGASTLKNQAPKTLGVPGREAARPSQRPTYGSGGGLNRWRATPPSS